MAKARRKSARKKSTGAQDWTGCGCPSNATKISTKKPGKKTVGRGWVCQSKTPKRGTNFRPFVAATCR